MNVFPRPAQSTVVRLVQVTIPTGKRGAVLDTLDDEGIDYVVTEETSGREYTAVVHFPLPTEAVEDILESLHDVGLAEDAYTIVLNAETVVSRQFDALSKRYEEESEKGGTSPDRNWSPAPTNSRQSGGRTSC